MKAVEMQEIMKDIEYMIMNRTNFKVEHIQYVNETELSGGRYFFVYLRNLGNNYTVKVELMEDNTVDLDGLICYLNFMEERIRNED